MASAASMSLKDWVDLFTGGGAAISAIAAGVAAWAARTSAGAAKESSESSRTAINSNERIADNDRRIRLMEERMRVWRAFDDLMLDHLINGISNRQAISEAHKEFQRAPFLFPPEVDKYLRKVVNRLLRQIHLQGGARIRQDPDDVRAAQRRAKKAYLLLLWLTNQQRDGKKIFQKHMSLID